MAGRQLSDYSKYVLAYRLIEFAQEIVADNQVESLCPEKLTLVNFDEEDLNNFAIVKNEDSEGVKERLKFYQAPEVIVGQPESEKSLAWTIGVMVDELFAGRCFYRKLTEIIGPKSTHALT